VVTRLAIRVAIRSDACPRLWYHQSTLPNQMTPSHRVAVEQVCVIREPVIVASELNAIK
jgi:hypothetical protein